MEVIRSLDNKRIKEYAGLSSKKNRDKLQLFIIQERHLIEEALKQKRIVTLIVLEGVESPYDCNTMYVSEAVMKKLSANTSLNKFIAVCRQFTLQPETLERIFVLEDVQDPGNVGTIIRMAHCFGYDAVYLTEGCADLYNSKTISASQGAFFHIPVLRKPMEEIFALIEDNGLTSYATCIDAMTCLSYVEIDDKYAVLMGNEGNGLSEETQNRADERVKIEMENFDSLNVAMAESFIGYHFRYQK